MKIEITNKRLRAYPAKFISHGCNVYVESNADAIIDAFFQEHKIWSLNFKSKTWSKMKTAATKLNVAAMRTVFSESDTKIAYSTKTGCPCGCSPEYKVRGLNKSQSYYNQDVWTKIKVDVSNIVAKLPDFEQELLAEITINNK